MNNWNFLYEKIEEAKLRQKQEQQEDIDVKKIDEEIQDDIFERVDSIISAGNELEKDLMEVDAGMENNSEITHGEETDSEAFLYENNKKINNLIARNNELQMKLDRLQKEYENLDTIAKYLESYNGKSNVAEAKKEITSQLTGEKTALASAKTAYEKVKKSYEELQKKKGKNTGRADKSKRKSE